LHSCISHFARCIEIRDWRNQHDVSAEDLAERCGIAASDLYCYENSIRRPRPEVASRIEAATRGEVTAASLLGLAVFEPHKHGVREDAASFGAHSPLIVEVPFPPEREKLLRDGGIDAAAIARAGAEKALKEAEAKAWAKGNREAIEASTAWIEKHGTLADQLGLV
jgi:post-segregation antitoxin (ccd killing protein)/DNA-binding transcriptional regulator YdaS (Cro superfamily)